MAVNVVTEFGANTQKFDAAVEKSTRKAQKNLENIGKGARVAGGKVGELTEKFNNLATGGKLGLIVAGLGLIAMAVKKVTDLSQDMFKNAAEDAKDIVRDVQKVNQINAVNINNMAAAQTALRQAVGKKDLSHQDMVILNNAIAMLEKKAGITGIRINDRQLEGYNEATDVRLSKLIAERNIEAKTREINAMKSALNSKQAELDAAKGDSEYATWWQNASQWVRYKTGINNTEITAASKEISSTVNNIMEAEMQRQRMIEEMKNISAKSDAFFKDTAEEAEKAEKEARRKQIKELEEKRAGISFLGGGQSQMFTNSLTSRGGWSGGGKIWDTGRYQQQMLQSNMQQQATLLSIENKIETLQRI
jgi:hypothetical protein